MSNASHVWPRAIFGFIGLFFLAMVGFVIYSTRQRTELVAPDYYDQEIRYQERIDATRRAAEAGLAGALRHDAATASLQVSLPGLSATGHVAAYRPSSAALDRTWPLALDEAGRQSIGIGDLAAGRWRISLTWYTDHLPHYTESVVELP